MITENANAEGLDWGPTIDIVLPRYQVLQHAEMAAVPKYVYQHELPILQEVVGEDKIEVIEGSLHGYRVPEFNVHQEYARLVSYYGLSQKKDAVRRIYGADARRLAEEIGVPYTARGGAARAQKVVSSQEVINQVDPNIVSLDGITPKKAAKAGKLGETAASTLPSFDPSTSTASTDLASKLLGDKTLKSVKSSAVAKSGKTVKVGAKSKK